MSDKPRLGADTHYPDHYAPELLVPISRAEGRRNLALPSTMQGSDLWTAWEVSWLEPGGKPRVAIAEIRVDAASRNLVESKSLKLYFNSLNETRFADAGEVAAVVERDLTEAFGGPLTVALFGIREYGERGLASETGVLLDDLEVRCEHYQPEPSLLAADRRRTVEETLCTHLFKSNCPVTGQPDWASLRLRYRGPAMDREGLLGYLVSFRRHQDFHEHCVERIFADLMARCEPERLSVEARYTRRGGLDINPFRSTETRIPAFGRTPRQ